MKNFDYQTPTRLIFGKDIVNEKLAGVMQQYGKRVLVTYGGGSIKRTVAGHAKRLYDGGYTELEGKGKAKNMIPWDKLEEFLKTNINISKKTN